MLKELLQEYRETLNQTLDQIHRIKMHNYAFTGDEQQEDYEILIAVEADLRHAIKWLEKGYQYDAHWRGVEKLDAYNLGEVMQEVPKLYAKRQLLDPYLMDFYVEDERAQKPFETIDNEDYRTIEDREWDERLDVQEKLIEKGLFDQMEQAKAILCHQEIAILVFHQQGISQEEMAGTLGVTQPAICQRIKSIKKKLAKIGVERIDL